jgi:hypothetical protein
MHVRTADDGDAGFIGEEFTAARVKRRLLAQSYIGGMFTRRDARGDGSGSSHTVGADFALSTATFQGNKNLTTAGWFLRESRPGVTSGTSAFGASIEYPNDRWSGGFNAREVQANFDPSVGFVARRNYRRYNQFIGFGPRPNNKLIRQVRLNGNLTVFTDLRNQMVERNLHLNFANFQFQSQDQVSVELDRNYIRLQTPFPISTGITLPMGNQYSFTRMAIAGRWR